MAFGLREILMLAPLAASAVATGGATLPLVALGLGAGSMATGDPTAKRVMGAGSMAAGIGQAAGLGQGLSGTPTGNTLGVPLQEATPGELSSIGMTPHTPPAVPTSGPRLQDLDQDAYQRYSASKARWR